MKKYFQYILIFLLIVFPFLVQHPQAAFAAGETWTWQANGSIQVTGGNLHAPGTIPSTGQGTLDINDISGTGGFCVLSVLPQLAADDKKTPSLKEASIQAIQLRMLVLPLFKINTGVKPYKLAVLHPEAVIQ